MLWWAWVILGLVLLAAELLTPGGFYLLFFGASALTVGLMQMFGIAGPGWLQWFLFSTFSVASILFLRKPLVRKFSSEENASITPTTDTDSVIGEVAVAAEDIASGAIGRVELRGSAWSACNRDPQVIVSGQRCVVERIDGLRLDVRLQK